MIVSITKGPNRETWMVRDVDGFDVSPVDGKITVRFPNTTRGPGETIVLDEGDKVELIGRGETLEEYHVEEPEPEDQEEPDGDESQPSGIAKWMWGLVLVGMVAWYFLRNH